MVAVPSIGRASLLEPQAVAPEAAAAHGLYERHAARIHGYCLHQLGSREEAEDAVQTTFMNAFRALGRGVVPEAEAAWLYKIAENVCLSRRRSEWRRNRIESPADLDVIEAIVPAPSQLGVELIGIEEALSAMPEQQRRAILLREWQGLSYREISTELELSQSAVETLIFRARRSLARGLTEPERVKRAPRRKGLRGTLHLADLVSLLAGAKSLLAGAAAVKATAAAVVVTAAAGTAVVVNPSLLDPPSKPPLAVTAAAPAPDADAAQSPSTRSAPRASSAPADVKPGVLERALTILPSSKPVESRRIPDAKTRGAAPGKRVRPKPALPVVAARAIPPGRVKAPAPKQMGTQPAERKLDRRARPERREPRARRTDVALVGVAKEAKPARGSERKAARQDGGPEPAAQPKAVLVAPAPDAGGPERSARARKAR